MKKIILSILALVSINWVTSQINFANVREGESVEYCLQHKKMSELRQNPAFMQMFLQEQAIFQAAEAQIAQDSTHSRVTYTIPIVFHILHNGGVENITNAQILDALEVLNRDYRMLNADAGNVQSDFNSTNPNAETTPADIEIQFVLATKAPNGSCFNGITRTQSPLSYVTSSQQGSSQVNAIINGNNVYQGTWPGNKYLNVFVCGNIGGAAGYTYTPSNWIGTGMDNGIWILHDYVGRIGTGGVGTDRALTHEVGHWLNLEHVWGGNNDPGSGICAGNATSNNDRWMYEDFVGDTPFTLGSTACVLSRNSCDDTDDPFGWSIYSYDVKDNVENYMDYSYCSKMFTIGQKTRMRAAIVSNVGGRNNVWTTQNLVATGADGNPTLCAADFYTDRTVVCSGSPIQFFDNSYNNVSTWSWSFPGAATTSSTEQNPTITYNTPGTYSVTLTAGDGNGTVSQTKTAYITVLNTGVALPLLDGFEPYTSIATSEFWETYNPQNNGTFQLSSTVGLSSSKSVMIPNFSQTGTGNLDELISQSVDLSSITSTTDITLTFRYSYRKKQTANSEKLFVLMTGNCGESWEVRKSIQGSSLSPLTSTTSWIPTTAADWTTVHVTNISSTYWNENFRFKFRFEGSGGNNLYLDNINLYNAGPSDTLIGNQANSILEKNSTSNFLVYPNPADNELNIEYYVNDNSRTEIKIVDLLGKIVDQKTILSATGNNLVVIGTEQLAPGIYNVNITIDGTNHIKQVVVK
ncbi:MAG: M43 family zinc metalloprotease [Flavobacteriia bacterium]|jgi:PKD repeat protein